jgi:hypothetical protein
MLELASESGRGGLGLLSVGGGRGGLRFGGVLWDGLVASGRWERGDGVVVRGGVEGGTGGHLLVKVLGTTEEREWRESMSTHASRRGARGGRMRQGRRTQESRS